jgi:hypothetical protein
MFQRLLHILYAIEFLIALIAVYTVWREVGGQVHLDYMAWYWKAAIGVPAAIAAVRLTMAMASHGPLRWRAVVMWIAVLLSLMICAGVVTYYYHLNEPQDESDEDPGAITKTALHSIGRLGAAASGHAGVRLQRRICRGAGVPAVPSRGVCGAIGVGTRAVTGAFEIAAAW